MKAVRSFTGEIFRVSLIFFFTGLLLTGCNDEPSPVGSSFLQDTVELIAVSSDSAALIRNIKVDRTLFTVASSAPGYVLLGEAPEAGGQIRSSFLHRPVNVPDTLGTVNANRIVSAKLFLKPAKYSFGEANGELAFKVHAIQQLWGPGQQSMPSYSSAAAGTFGPRKLDLRLDKDTILPDSIVLDIERSVVANWFYQRERYLTRLREIDTMQFPGSAEEVNAKRADLKAKEVDSIFGIALLPDPGSKIIHQFYSSLTQLGPRLEVVYDDPDHADTGLDTVNLIGGTADQVYTSFPPASEDPGDIVVRGLNSAKTRFEFDLSGIPRNVAVQVAELVLTINREKSTSGTNSRDSSFALAEPFTTTGGSLVIRHNSTRDTDPNFSDRIIFPSLGRNADEWVHGSGRGTLILMQGQQFEREFSLNKVVFYGMDADSTKRPRLRILYSTRPQLK